MRERTEIESELRTLKTMEADDGGAAKGIYLLLDVVENQQLLIETLLDIRDLLKQEKKKKG